MILFTLSVSSISAQDLRHYQKDYTDSLNHSSLYYPYKELSISPKQPKTKRNTKSWIRDKFLHENFLKVKTPEYTLTLDPLFNNYYSKEFISNKNLYGNTRAIRAQGIFTFNNATSICHPGESRDLVAPAQYSSRPRTLEFSTVYYESQTLFPPYLDSIIKEYRVVPGQMIYRGSGRTMDHSYAEGWLRYTPNKTFSFEVGHGKNFFGNGYRSLLLSDAAPNYPYARIDSKFWRIHYVNLWAEFQDINYWEEYGQTYQKKYAAMHYLSLAVTNNFEFNLFEAINWQGIDDSHTRNFELNYLNPIIFLRPVEWTVGSPDNALFGAGFSYRIPKLGLLYGQFIMDEFNIRKIIDWSKGSADNKLGGQLGLKLKGKKTFEWFFQTEFNAVRPYTYSHISSKSNYGHFNQSLAHPLQANFYEWVNFLRIRKDRWLVEGRYSWARFGSDVDGSNYGHNISLSYLEQTSSTGVFIGNGLRNDLTYIGLTASYLLNPYSNFNVFTSVLYRNQLSSLNKQQDLIFNIGLRSSIRNMYYDY